jgi:hypothetical protein
VVFVGLAPGIFSTLVVKHKYTIFKFCRKKLCPPRRFDLLVVDQVRVLEVTGVVRHRRRVQEHVPVLFGLELKVEIVKIYQVKGGVTEELKIKT